MSNEIFSLGGKCLRFSTFQNFQLIHDYGHGGNGFVLHWGCAQEVADFVENIRKEKRKI
jgi:hypothetical protein